MTNNRKTIKITIPADKVEVFAEAKAKAEQSAMIKLTDTQYASRLIQWALDQKSEGRARINVLQSKTSDNCLVEPNGVVGSPAFNTAIEIMKAWEETLNPY